MMKNTRNVLKLLMLRKIQMDIFHFIKFNFPGPYFSLVIKLNTS